MAKTPYSGLAYRLVDVFTDTPLTGNGLAVFPESGHLDAETMQALTREMRQFESIFLMQGSKPGSGRSSYRARLFTVDEELDFAGHPVLGAAAVLHELQGQSDEQTWTVELNAKTVTVRTRPEPGGYRVAMDQGKPEFGQALDPANPRDAAQAEQAATFARAMNLELDDLVPGLPLQVVSTGLPYLIIPVRGALARAKPVLDDLEGLLATVGAKFCYVLDLGDTLEGRTWDNTAKMEDPATGSAAGPVGVYLVRHGLARCGREILLRQGRFVHRPSLLHITVRGKGAEPETVIVAGSVRMSARGMMD